jgi:hypothetical protein
MKSKPKSEEYTAFKNLLGEVLQVSKTELNQRMEEERREKRTPEKRKPSK